MGTEKINWETEGDQIRPEIAMELLYKNASIESFLGTVNKHFIVATKGLGKTVILKTKRFILEKNNQKTGKDNQHTQSPSFFVPSDAPYLDALDRFGTLDISKINALSDYATAIKVWEFAIQLSAITVFNSRTKCRIAEDLISTLPEFITKYIENNIELSPCSVLGLVLRSTVSIINQIIDNYFADVSIHYKNIHTPINFFIDRVDQSFLSYEEKIWHSMQIGLMEAAWNCMRTNHHIKIYSSVRIEAYKNYNSANSQSLSGEVIEIAYDKNELEELLNTLSNYYEEKDFDDFIGFKDFINPLTNRIERVIDYIYRHTTGTPRNLVKIILALNLEKSKRKTFDFNKLREIVNAVSHESIAPNTIAENTLFLDSLSKPSEIQRFFSLIHRNILYKDELKSICRKFNNIDDSIENGDDSFLHSKSDILENDCKNCFDCHLSHPFCELSNIGLLGSVVEFENQKKQKFIEPHWRAPQKLYHC